MVREGANAALGVEEGTQEVAEPLAGVDPEETFEAYYLNVRSCRRATVVLEQVALSAAPAHTPCNA